MSRVDELNKMFEMVNQNLIEQTDQRVRELEKGWTRFDDIEVKRMTVDGREVMVCR